MRQAKFLFQKPRFFVLAAELTCPQLDTPKNGWKSNNESVLHATVMLGCNKGYRLVGDSSLTCMPDQQWNGETPSCKGIYIFKASWRF